MGVRLMVEVLDHYHGPQPRKLWLLAWAEHANDQTRQGWPGRSLLARRADVSPTRASNIATELADEGVIKRVGGGGRHRGEARYELLPLSAGADSQGSELTHPESSVRVRNRGSQGSESGSQGSAISRLPAETSYNPQNPQEPSSARAGEAVSRAVRVVFPDATDDEIKTITKDAISHGARNVSAVIRSAVSKGILRLPCDRAGPGRHSEACRNGSGDCGYGWCQCRCHIQPEAGAP